MVSASNSNVPEPSGPRILVVEDMALVANEIERQLRMAGYRVVGPFDSVDTALAALGKPETVVDAALLDINLAGMPCYPVADVLIERQIPMCFLTGYLRDYLPDDYSDLPFLEKPFSRDDLRNMLRQLLHPAQHHSG